MLRVLRKRGPSTQAHLVATALLGAAFATPLLSTNAAEGMEVCGESETGRIQLEESCSGAGRPLPSEDRAFLGGHDGAQNNADGGNGQDDGDGQNNGNGGDGQDGADDGADHACALTSVLPSSVTLRGTYVVNGYKPALEKRSARSAISFGFELGPLEAEWIRSPDEATRECFGSVENPQAAPGFLCLYQQQAKGILRVSASSPDGRVDATGSFGAVIQTRSDPTFEGRFYSVGSWAATPR